MIIYLGIAIFMFLRYRKRKSITVNNEDPSPKIYLAGGVFFMIAAVLNLVEVLMQIKNQIFNILMIISGLIVLYIIFKEERKKSKESKSRDEIEKDRIRNEIIYDTQMSVTQYKNGKKDDSKDSEN